MYVYIYVYIHPEREHVSQKATILKRKFHLNLEPTIILLDISVFRGVYVITKVSASWKKLVSPKQKSQPQISWPLKIPDPEISWPQTGPNFSFKNPKESRLSDLSPTHFRKHVAHRWYQARSKFNPFRALAVIQGQTYNPSRGQKLSKVIPPSNPTYGPAGQPGPPALRA